MAGPITNNYTQYNNKTQANSVGQNEFYYDDGSKNEVNMQSFLQLMIAQLQNQDFNNTVDDTQYITQLAQFSSLQAMTDLTANSKLNYASSLVGNEVAVQDITGKDPKIVTGYVEAMSIENDVPVIYVNKVAYSLGSILQVYPNTDQINALTNLTSLSMMQMATSLLGSNVEIVDNTDKNNPKVINGEVTSFARVDGESKIFIDGVAYSLSNVVKVYPKGTEPPVLPEKPDEDEEEK